MKAPDCLYEDISEEVALECEMLHLDNEETEIIKESHVEKVKQIVSRWFEYGEYLTVEIDTDTETCAVVPLK